MKKFMRVLGNHRGVGMIEVMIALILTGIVTIAIMRTYVIQHENYLVQDDVTTMQQSARACIDELSKQIRMAGHQLPMGVPAIVASNTNPDTITVTYHGNDCETYLSVAMAETSSELQCGSDVSCFRADQWVYIFQADSAKGEWFEISAVVQATQSVQHSYSPANLSRKYGANSQVLALNEVKFFINKTADPTNPKLMVKIGGSPAVPYAEHITDLQFRYRLANGNIVDVPVLINDVREVLISISAGSTMPHFDGQQTKDRTYTSSVSLRNIGV